MKRRVALAVFFALAVGSGGCELRRSAPGSATASRAPAGPAVAATGASAPGSARDQIATASGSCGAGGSCAGAGGSCGASGGSCGEDCGKWEQPAAAVASRKVPADAEWTSFSVKGMHCGNCERRVMANLGQLNGVVGVEADAELGVVRVATKPGDPGARSAARARLDTLGYKVIN